MNLLSSFTMSLRMSTMYKNYTFIKHVLVSSWYHTGSIDQYVGD